MRTALGILLLAHFLFFSVFYISSAVLFGRDLPFLHVPLKMEAARQVASGHLPSWTDRATNGMPLLADPSASALYPPTWLLALPRPLKIFTMIMLGHHLLLAIGFYLLAMRWLQDPWKALMAALMISCSGLVLGMTGFANPLWGTAWLPWMLLGWLNYQESGRPAWLGLAGVCFGLAILAGFDLAPLLFPGVLLAVILIHGNPKRELVPAGVIVTGGLLLSAVQWLPTLCYLPHTVRALPKPYALSEGYYSLHPLRTLEVFLPGIDGRAWSPQAGAYWGDRLADNILGLYPSPYLGLTALAVLLVFARGSRRMWAWIGLGVAAVLMSWGRFFLFHPLLQKLPGMSVFRFPEKFLLFAALGFFFALLEALRDPRPPRREGALVAAFIGPLILAADAVSGGALLRAFLARTASTPAALHLHHLRVTLAVLSLLGLLIAGLLWAFFRHRRLFVWLSLLLAADLFWAGRGRIAPGFPEELASNPLVQEAPDGETRLLYWESPSLYTDAAATWHAAYRDVVQFKLNSMAPLSGMLTDRAYGLTNLIDQMEPACLPYGRGQAILSFWGVTHVIAAGGDPPWPGLEKTGEYPGFAVYKVNGALSSFRWRAEGSPENSGIPLDLSGIRQGAGRYRIPWAASMPRVLEAAQANLPGWTLRIDGKPFAIAESSLPYLRLHLPAGARVVELRYVPPGFLPGVILSAAGGLGILALLAVGRAPRRGKSRSDPEVR
jgi:hypothetical protein